MVSWEKSLIAALKVLGYSILWWVIGVAIILIGFTMIGGAIFTEIFTEILTGKGLNFLNVLPNFATTLIGLIVVGLGYIIAFIGSLASFMKVFTEMIAEETGRGDNRGHNDALEEFEKAIKKAIEDADKWYYIGIELAELGRHNDALKAYKKAIEIKPDYADAWFNRACIYCIRGEKEKALYDLKKAIELDISNKERAKKEKDFEKLWDDEDFKRLVAS